VPDQQVLFMLAQKARPLIQEQKFYIFASWKLMVEMKIYFYT
jgi:hypothetical protein